jgi:hypothetical protein
MQAISTRRRWSISRACRSGLAALREHAKRGIRLGYRGVVRLRKRSVDEAPRPGRPVVRVDGAGIPGSFDAFTRSWVRRTLHGRCDPPPCPGDPEVLHDRLRLRGVLAALAEMYRDGRDPPVLERMDALLEHTMRLADRHPAEGWDTSSAALRVVSLLGAQAVLGPAGLALPAMDGRLRGFLEAHAHVLAWGAVSEPAGNHELVNGAGRAALHLLLHPDAPLGKELADDFSRRFRAQFLADGGHVERSPHYHAQVLALAELVCRVDTRRGGALERSLAPVLERARQALAGMLVGGSPFRLGDISRTFSGRRASADVSAVLGGRTFAHRPLAVMADFGIGVVRWTTGTAEFCLVMDVGEIGHRPNAGHGHADALSYCFFVNGHEVVADPGTYLYADSAESMWFKLPEAHGSVRWPHHPSYRLSRFFRWSRTPPAPGFARGRSGPSTPTFRAVQEWRTGGHRYVHAREWIPLPRGVAVVDRVGSGSGRPALGRVPLHPRSSVTLDGRRAVLEFPGGRATVQSRGRDAGAFRERTGWYAPAYGEMSEASALEWPILAPGGGGTSCTVIRVDA